MLFAVPNEIRGQGPTWEHPLHDEGTRDKTFGRASQQMPRLRLRKARDDFVVVTAPRHLLHNGFGEIAARMTTRPSLRYSAVRQSAPNQRSRARNAKMTIHSW